MTRSVRMFRNTRGGGESRGRFPFTIQYSSIHPGAPGQEGALTRSYTTITQGEWVKKKRKTQKKTTRILIGPLTGRQNTEAEAS